MTNRSQYFQEAQIPDIERRLADVVRIGRVEKQDFSDPAAPRVRVRSAGKLTGWLPWTAGRAGGDTQWDPLDMGEQVIMVAPSGDLTQAVIIGSIHQKSAPAPENGADVQGRRWKDGAVDRYDRENHVREIKVPEGGAIRFTIGATTWELTAQGAKLVTPVLDITAQVKIKGDIDVEGGIKTSEDVRAQNVSLINHKNTGVLPGPGLSGPPEN